MVYIYSKCSSIYMKYNLQINNSRVCVWLVHNPLSVVVSCEEGWLLVLFSWNAKKVSIKSVCRYVACMATENSQGY